MHGEGSPGQQCGAGRAEIVGRDLEVLRIGRGIRGPVVRGGVGIHIGIAAADAERQPIGITHGGDTGDRGGGIEHALLHQQLLLAAISRHVQIGLHQHRALGLNAIIALQ